MFSILIATYNRAALLEETLVSLERHLGLINPDIEIEVVIIDNNSSDETSAVAVSFYDRLPGLRVVKETQQGLSFARNRGVLESKGDIVVFLDDDVELDDRWLAELLSPFSMKDVSVVGSKVLPFGRSELPAWLPRRFAYLASVFDPSDEPGDIESVMGASFAVRKSCFNSIGTFNTALGRRGSKLLGGEEIELFKRIRDLGLRIYYNPHSVVFHKIEAKLRPEYIEEYAYWLGVSEALIDLAIHGRSKFVLKCIRSMFFPYSVDLVQRFFSKESSRQMNYLIKSRYAKGYLQYRIALE